MGPAVVQPQRDLAARGRTLQVRARPIRTQLVGAFYSNCTATRARDDSGSILPLYHYKAHFLSSHCYLHVSPHLLQKCAVSTTRAQSFQLFALCLCLRLLLLALLLLPLLLLALLDLHFRRVSGDPRAARPAEDRPSAGATEIPSAGAKAWQARLARSMPGRGAEHPSPFGKGQAGGWWLMLAMTSRGMPSVPGREFSFSQADLMFSS